MKQDNNGEAGKRLMAEVKVQLRMDERLKEKKVAIVAAGSEASGTS